MHARQNALNKWLKDILGDTAFTLTPLAGDASFRRYFRMKQGETTRVVMDAPPDKENIEPFLNVSHILTAGGIHTPTVYAVEEAQGFILLEDLGDELLFHTLSPNNVDELYHAAITTLLTIQQCPTAGPNGTLPLFDKAFMLQELALFREWFLHRHLAISLTAEDEHLLAETFDWLTEQLKTQPQVFIHRDYHSRNLMLLRKNNALELGIIDYQDAMRGPFTYDLVSLLKDCYVQWPRAHVNRWLADVYERLPTAEDYSLATFIQAFDLCGLQRHLKVLGVFCRLYLRDNKPGYLRDLPLTFNYTMACLESYPELQTLHRFMQQKVFEPFTRVCQ